MSLARSAQRRRYACVHCATRYGLDRRAPPMASWAWHSARDKVAAHDDATQKLGRRREGPRSHHRARARAHGVVIITVLRASLHAAEGSANMVGLGALRRDQLLVGRG